MKNALVIGAVITVILAIPSFAADIATRPSASAPTFEQRQARILKIIDAQISSLQTGKACVRAAKNSDDLNDCKEKLKAEIREKRAEKMQQRGMDGTGGPIEKTEKGTASESLSPPAKDTLPDIASVTIIYRDHQYIIGEMGVSDSDAGGLYPNIIIFRKIPPDMQKRAAELGLEDGSAYLKTSSRDWRFVRKVDLNKSDQEIAAEFGVKNTR